MPRGGKRDGSGRKKVEDRKVQLSIYVSSKKLEVIGEEKIKEYVLALINRLYDKAIIG